jgi:biotin carboxyl carrier protein
VEPGRLLGTLRVLSRRVPVLAPEGAAGVLRPLGAPGQRSWEVDYGAGLFRIVSLDAGDRAATAARPGSPGSPPSGSALADLALAVRAPIHGIFYGRPSPGAPPFVQAGDRIAPGKIVGLVEVMKTFNPLRWDGPGDATVERVAAAERQEVTAGEALVLLRPV